MELLQEADLRRPGARGCRAALPRSYPRLATAAMVWAMKPELKMSETPSPSTLRLLVGILLGASATLIGIAVWMITKHEGSPIWVALGGSMLACVAAVIASQTRKKR